MTINHQLVKKSNKENKQGGKFSWKKINPKMKKNQS